MPKASAPAAAAAPRPSTASPPRQRRKEARPQELLEAALALFVEKGFAATRSEAVAARAGVSKGTLYLYYPSKEELFKAVVRESLASHIQVGKEMVAQARGSTAELMRELLREWWQRIGQGPAGGICKIMTAEARNFPELACFYMDEVIVPALEMLGAMVQRGVASGEFRAVPVAETVQVLIAPVMHLVLFEHSFGACRAMGPEPDPEAVLAVQLDLMLRGLLARPDPGAPAGAASSPNVAS